MITCFFPDIIIMTDQAQQSSDDTQFHFWLVSVTSGKKNLEDLV